jgi:hypothetical protein
MYGTWVLLVAVLVTAISGCKTVCLVSTDGKTFSGPLGGWYDLVPVMVKTSAAHDLQCPLEQIVASRHRDNGRESIFGHYIAEGCGTRALYDVFDDGQVVRALLLSRVTLSLPSVKP